MDPLVSDWLRHFLLSSATMEWNWTKHDSKQVFNVLYKVCVFKQQRWPSWLRIGWDIFDFSAAWTEFKETWQEISTQPSTKFMNFSIPDHHSMAALASNWPRHYLLLLCNLYRIWRSLTGSKYLTCLSGWSKHQDGCPCLWLAEPFFDFFATAEQNFKKLDRKQVLYTLYQDLSGRYILHIQPSYSTNEALLNH